MNLPLAAVGALLLFALLAHVLAGLHETASVRPSLIVPQGRIDDATSERLERNWTQALCAFQLVTVDLSVLALLSFLLAFADVIPQRKPVALALAGFFVLWGFAWLAQLVALKTPRRNYLLLGHWMFWFVCAGLAFWGAQLS